ncbi:hypothetical protein MP638_001489 [Amoeboaphelidium occidentale]|nr:hypothetical protein MP638_001489 [Amoeboaphelidium occidentale]
MFFIYITVFLVLIVGLVQSNSNFRGLPNEIVSTIALGLEPDNLAQILMTNKAFNENLSSETFRSQWCSKEFQHQNASIDVTKLKVFIHFCSSIPEFEQRIEDLCRNIEEFKFDLLQVGLEQSAFEGNLKLMEIFIMKRAKLTKRVFEIACLGGKIHAVIYLLESGFSIPAKSTALEFAIRSGNMYVSGFSIPTKSTALEFAIRSGNMYVVNHIVAHVDCSYQNWQALYMAIWLGNNQAVSAIKRKCRSPDGKTIDFVDAVKDDILDEIAKKDNLDALKLLLGQRMISHDVVRNEVLEAGIEFGAKKMISFFIQFVPDTIGQDNINDMAIYDRDEMLAQVWVRIAARKFDFCSCMQASVKHKSLKALEFLASKGLVSSCYGGKIIIQTVRSNDVQVFDIIVAFVDWKANRNFMQVIALAGNYEPRMFERIYRVIKTQDESLADHMIINAINTNQLQCIAQVLKSKHALNTVRIFQTVLPERIKQLVLMGFLQFAA